LESVFDVPDGLGLDHDILLVALSYRGGGSTPAAARILLRTSVAALLNAAHPDVNYPRTAAQVTGEVDATLAGGERAAMLDLASQLDGDNNLGCPLN
jgi:hypothetical protein